ncbi:MAG TPA: hypothetical protein DCQ04_07675 [Actinobacteria bacterium]|nr:hypothetical protein [Actinomycetota bacterium]
MATDDEVPSGAVVVGWRQPCLHSVTPIRHRSDRVERLLAKGDHQRCRRLNELGSKGVTAKWPVGQLDELSCGGALG